MKEINIAALKARLSQNLHAVEGGETVIITDRGRPIARLLPVEKEQPFRLETRPPRVPGGFVGLKIAAMDDPVDPLAALMAERGERTS